MLDDLLKANEAYISRGGRGGPPLGSSPKLVVVACDDARLTGLLEPALGLDPGEATVIRNAGGTITAGDDSVMRSVAAAVYAHGVRCVAVVGHSDCKMAGDSRPFIDGMSRAGVARSSLGGRDLREWLGLFGSVETNVRTIIQTLKESPALPAGIDLYGLWIDSATGKLRVILQEKTAGATGVGAAAPERTGGILSMANTTASMAPAPAFADFKMPEYKMPEFKMPEVVLPKPFIPRSSGAKAPGEGGPDLSFIDVTGEAEFKPKPEPPRKAPDTQKKGAPPNPVPMDPKAAQEYFWKREQERLRTKRRGR